MTQNTILSSKDLIPTNSFCPVQDCGGCPLRAYTKESTFIAKDNFVKQSLSVLAHNDLCAVDVRPLRHQYQTSDTTSPISTYLGYRHRVRLHAYKNKIGYEATRSNHIINFKQCPILWPAFEKKLGYLVKNLTQQTPLFGDIEVIFDPHTQHMAAEFMIPKNRFEDLMAQAIYAQINHGLLSGALIYTTTHNDQETRITALHRRYQDPFVLLSHPSFLEQAPGFYLEPGVFCQANWTLNQALLEFIVEHLSPTDTVFELHAGAGNLTLAAAKHVQDIYTTEWDERALMCLRRNVNYYLGNKNNTKIIQASDTQAIGELNKLQKSPNVLLLDPPRRGAQQALSALLNGRHQPSRLIYMSCDLLSFIQDAKLISKHYQLIKMQPFDMFFGTPHLEFIGIFERITP